MYLLLERSQSADYVAKDTDFPYSLLLHLDINKEQNGAVLANFDYDLLYAQEDEKTHVHILHVEKEKIQRDIDCLCF